MTPWNYNLSKLIALLFQMMDTIISKTFSGFVI